MAKGNVPPTPQICEVCLKTQSVSDRALIATYCVHHQTGGFMPLRNGEPVGMWALYGPITAEAWADAIIDGRDIVATLLSEKLASAGGQPPDHIKTEH